MSNPVLDAADTISAAASFVRALEMTTRDRTGPYADPDDCAAVSAVCFAALNKLAEANALLKQAAEGEASR